VSVARRRELLTIVANAFSELATLEHEQQKVEVYTSRHLPPDVPSRTLFARACRSIPEARRQGKTWIVPRAAWERARRPRRAERNRDRDDLRDSLGLARRAA
jgi:hypothetical protein